MKKVCSKCTKEKDITEFNFKNKAKGKRQAHCKACQSIIHREFYDKDRARYKVKTKISKAKYVKRNHLFVFEYLSSHPCATCGIEDVTVLEFHHMRDKETEVSSLIVAGCSIKRVQAEIEKCIVLCANCHRKETAKGNGGHPFKKYGWI